MKTSFHLIFKALCLFILFYSCKKLEEANPQTGPLTFQGITNHDTLSNTVSASLSETNAGSVSKIEVYIDDKLLSSATSLPFNFTWNTRSVVDGSYTVKGVVYDQKGGKTEVSLPVVVKNILMTVRIDPKVYSPSYLKSAKYIITDSVGNVVQNVTYNGADTILRLTAATPLLSDRFNAYEILTTTLGYTYVTGYLNIKRGSDWDRKAIKENLDPVITAVQTNFINLPAFSRFTSSSDIVGFTNTNPAQIAAFTNYGYSSTGKMLVQYVDQSDQGHYKFFDIDKTKSTAVIDLKDTIHNSLKVTVNTPGATDGNFTLYGYADQYQDYYLLDSKFYQGSTVNYFYPPDGNLKRFASQFTYNKGGMMYVNVYKNLIPASITPYNVSVNFVNKSLDNLQFNIQGNCNYYEASFYNQPSNTFIEIYGRPGTNSYSFPDILKYTSTPALKPTDFHITVFGMYTAEGFQEDKLYYKNYKSFPGLVVPQQSAEIHF